MTQEVLGVYGEYSDDAILSPVAGEFVWVKYSREERRAVRIAKRHMLRP